MARVLLPGYAPESLDFSDPAFLPGMTVEKVHGGSRCDEAVAERGWEADVCLIQPDETARPAAERQLASKSYDCVVVGGGVRLATGGALHYSKSSSTLFIRLPGCGDCLQYTTRR